MRFCDYAYWRNLLAKILEYDTANHLEPSAAFLNLAERIVNQTADSPIHFTEDGDIAEVKCPFHSTDSYKPYVDKKYPFWCWNCKTSLTAKNINERQMVNPAWNGLNDDQIFQIIQTIHQQATAERLEQQLNSPYYGFNFLKRAVDRPEFKIDAATGKNEVHRYCIENHIPPFYEDRMLFLTSKEFDKQTNSVDKLRRLFGDTEDETKCWNNRRKMMIESKVIIEKKRNFNQYLTSQLIGRIIRPVYDRNQNIVAIDCRLMTNDQTVGNLTEPKSKYFMAYDLPLFENGRWEPLPNSGHSKSLYQEEILDQHQTVFVVEGSKDAELLGGQGIYAVGCGTAKLSYYQLGRLLDKTIIFGFDNDDAGRKGIFHGIFDCLLSNVPCYVCQPPSSFKDWADALKDADWTVERQTEIDSKYLTDFNKKYQLMNPYDWLFKSWQPNEFFSRIDNGTTDTIKLILKQLAWLSQRPNRSYTLSDRQIAALQQLVVNSNVLKTEDLNDIGNPYRLFQDWSVKMNTFDNVEWILNELQRFSMIGGNNYRNNQYQFADFDSQKLRSAINGLKTIENQLPKFIEDLETLYRTAEPILDAKRWTEYEKMAERLKKNG